MTTNTNLMGVKISEFNVANSLTDAALIPFVSNGTNLTISFANLKNELGVTGAIKSAASASAVPILDQASGQLNYIKGLIGSQGVTTTQSPLGDVSIKTNLANGLGGDAEIIADPTAAQIKMRSLKAGDGVELEQTNDNITIKTTTATVSTKTVIVSEESDFPVPVSGVITLENNTDYFIANDIVTTNRFVVGTATTLRGPASQIVKLTYTGVDTMLTSTEPNFRIDRISIACPNGTVFDMSSSGTGIFEIIESNIFECNTIGTIGDMFTVSFKGLTLKDIKTDGVTFTGFVDKFFSDVVVSFFNGVSGTLYDLNNGTFNSLTISNQFDAGTVAYTFLSGLVSSGNINVGGLGVVTNCRLQSTTTPLSNVSPNDSRWNFALNDAISDTRPESMLSFATPTTTTIVTAGTPVKVAGTWTSESSSQMTGSTDGRITYNGERNAILPINLSISLEPVSGSNKNLSVNLFKNGTLVANSAVSAIISASSPLNLVAFWQDNWATNDYYEIFVQNDTDTTNIQVDNAIFRVG